MILTICVILPVPDSQKASQTDRQTDRLMNLSNLSCFHAPRHSVGHRRFTAGVVTACTSMVYTGSLATAASIVGWDLVSKSATMFIGERLWNKVEWGKDGKSDSAKRSLAKAIAWRRGR